MHRAIATAAVAAAGLAGTLSTVPSANADDTSAAPAAASQKVMTKFGHEAWAYGTKVLVNGVEVKTLRDANAKQWCTAKAGTDVVQNSLATVTDLLPDQIKNLVKIAPSVSETHTYQDKSLGINGVKALNTIADVEIGGQLIDDVSIPTIKIEGLQSVADSFFDAKANNGKGAFGTDESFGFKGISIDYSGTVVDGTPLATLLDIVNSVTTPVNEVVNQLVELLTSVAGNTIEIPGLGSIGLGSKLSKVDAHSATSNAYALALDLFPSSDSPGTKIVLGNAKTRLSDGITSGVFRSNVMGLDLNVGDGLLHLGGIQNKGIPCEGTNGKTYTKTVAALPQIPVVSEIVNAIINMSSIKYTYMGKRLSKGRAVGVVTSQLGQLDVPLLGLTVKGLTQKVKIVSNSKSQPVERHTSVTVGDILLDGQSVLAKVKPLLQKGFELVSQTGQKSFLKFLNAIPGMATRNGTGITGLKLKFGDSPITADFGWTSLHYVREQV